MSSSREEAFIEAARWRPFRNQLATSLQGRKLTSSRRQRRPRHVSIFRSVGRSTWAAHLPRVCEARRPIKRAGLLIDQAAPMEECAWRYILAIRPVLLEAPHQEYQVRQRLKGARTACSLCNSHSAVEANFACSRGFWNANAQHGGWLLNQQ